MKPLPTHAAGAETIPFLRSPLNVLLLLAVLILVSIGVNGYMSFRSDHLSQIPLIYLQGDPTLFPRDWFFQNYGHFKLRFLHLAAIKGFSFALGIPGALLFIYVLCIASTLGAWLAIARHLHGSILPGIVACFLGILFYGEVGANHLIERALIPRTEAFAIIYWGVLLLLRGRPLVAGLLFGAASCFQPAVGIQFAIPMILWLAIAGEGPRLRQIAFFLASFAAVLGPWMLFLGGSFTGESTLTDAEIVNIVAYLRHPGLMIPRYFGRSIWAVFCLLVIWAVIAWRNSGRDNERVRRAGWIVPIMTGLLFLAAVFIELVPVKNVILFQPFRASVLLYLFIFLLIAPYPLSLLRSAEPFRRFRGVLLILSVFIVKLFAPVLLFEAIVAWRERRGQSQPTLEWAALTLMVILGGFLIEPEVGGRSTTWTLLGWAFLLSGALHAMNRIRLWERPAALRAGLTVVAVLGFGLMVFTFRMPFERWIDDHESRRGRIAAQLAWRYQFAPSPIKAIERLGVWAGEHTPETALFIIPPERSAEGFHIWSKRSAVFNIKFFPVTQAAYEEWRNRYLAHCGILDPDAPESSKAVHDAMNDVWLKEVEAKYAGLGAEDLVALAMHYGAEFIITPTPYETPKLRLLTSDFDRTTGVPDAQRLFLFEVVGR
jgi:hypothetical protein